MKKVLKVSPKRIVVALPIAIALAVVLVFAVLACNCYVSLNVDADQCETVDADAAYYGNSHEYNKAELYIDGNLVKSKEGYGNVSVHYSSSMSPGGHIAVVKGYEWDPGWWIFPGSWDEKGTKTESFTVQTCHNYTLQLHQNTDCRNTVRYSRILDNGVPIEAWVLFADVEWSEPYSLEVLPAATVDRGVASGTFPAMNEPASCQIFRTYKAHQAYLENSCEGIRRVINLYEGPADDPYATLVGTLYNEVLLFTDPYVGGEVIPAVTVDVPAEYGPDYTFAAMVEPEYCYVTCSITIEGEPGPWSDWAYDVDRGLEVRTRNVPVLDSQDPEIVCGTNVEEDTHVPDYHPAIIPLDDCEGWLYLVNPAGADYEVLSGTLFGLWLDPYAPENNAVDVPTIRFTFPSGYVMELTANVIAKDNECLQCKVTNLYYQYAYQDYDAPGVYWPGPFERGPGIAVIINKKGEVPSAERVTVLSSLCPDQYPPDGYIYTADVLFAGGYVKKVECYGKEPYYTFLGYLWNEWVKLGMYNKDSERICPRLEGCSAWIHEQIDQ